MKKLLLKGRTALAIISGIIFFGFLLKSIDTRLPVELAQATQNTVVPTIEENITQQIKQETITTEKVVDKRVVQIERYLSKRNAPLAEYAETFVKYADKYGIDYRLVAAISVIESNGGKDTFRKYNAWGWGKSGFENWDDGIKTVSKGLANYYSRGLTTPKLIAKYYCPPSATHWASKVQFVMNEISQM